MKAEPASVVSKDNAVRMFFVRVPSQLKEQAMELFGRDIDEVRNDNVHGEFAFVTKDLSEKDFEEKLWKLDSVKGYLRLY